LISTFIENEIPNSFYLIIEHNNDWGESFSSQFRLSPNARIEYCPLVQIIVDGYSTNSYEGVLEKVVDKFDFYIIDGPLGSDRFSRFDMLSIAKLFDIEDEFVILIDDFDREGERIHV
jgi:hypothetical protein